MRHEVTAIDREKKTVSVLNLETGERLTESYDKLILSPGAVPVRPKLPGIESERIQTLRTVEDTLRIRAMAVGQKLKSAVVVGGGFIGVEMAENLRGLGMAVSLIEMQPQVLGQFDGDMASFLHAHMKKHGVELLLGRAVAGFADTESGVRVSLGDGAELETDLVILAIGVAPDSRLARDAGLSLGARGSIAVNDRMQTSDPDIYAVGDAVEIAHRVTGQRTTVPLAGPANKQGRIAADNIAGLESAYKGAAGTSVLKVFDMTAASTGLSERAAQAAGIPYQKIILSPASHAAYYPGGSVMTMKLLFSPAGERILGAQIVGFDGVDKRIDVLATAMQAGLPVTALTDLDLAYAPPYASAKDPVNMAGFIAENVLSGRVKQFFYEDLAALPTDGSVTLLDTRTNGEYAGGHAEGFTTHIPVDDLRARIGELDKSKPVYVMCQSGLRSYIACRILAQNGFDCRNFAGGYRFYASVQRDHFDEGCRTDCGAPPAQGTKE